MKWIVYLLLIMVVGCQKGPEERPYSQIGEASFYARFFSGETTANGEVYDPTSMTAAHRHLPFGTVVEVKNLTNDKAVQVIINDRGPFVGEQIVDLSRAAADSLEIVEEGVVMVELEVVKAAEGYAVSDSVARELAM
jgi:rare lipoprotein A